MVARTGRHPFASLTPRNQSAVLAFSRLCDYLQQNPSEYTHHRQFMQIHPVQIPLGQALYESTEPVYSTDATEASPENDPLEERVWTGSFVFDLDSPPELPQIGWRCGYGRWSKDLIGRLDIAVCLPEDGKRLRVHGNHLSFNFLVETGVFAIRANILTWVDAQHVVRSHNNGICILNKPLQILDIGEAKYEFKYTVEDEDTFAEARAEYLRDVMHQSSSLICESPTPSKEDIQVGKWRLFGAVGRGSESVVVSAISAENQLVVVKTLNKIRCSDQDIDREIRRYRNITDKAAGSEDSRFLLAFLESIAGDHTTYLVFSPHARHDFDVLTSHPRMYSRQLHSQLFLQALRGVRALHAAGFMHRDLKPGNIGICSLDPPHAIVLDMGLTVEAEDRSEPKARPGTIGTVAYIAPEIEDVRVERFGMEVDIWAMACVGLQILLPLKGGPSIPWIRTYHFPTSDGKGHISKKFNPWRTFETFKRPRPMELDLEAQRKLYTKEFQRLDNSEDLLENLLAEMLSERPHWRPKISEVIHRLGALHFDDWPGQSTAGGVPPLLLCEADLGEEHNSMIDTKRSKRSEVQQAV